MVLEKERERGRERGEKYSKTNSLTPFPEKLSSFSKLSSD
jgi:hypothetical protein